MAKKKKTAARKKHDAIKPQTWKRLYKLAKEVKELAPWDWVSESEFFGVQDPATGDQAFISIMGMNGEHFALAAYLGAKGLYGYWHMANAGPLGNPEEILEVPQLQLSFEDRDILTDRDRQRIKLSGERFRGRNAWPMFRSYRPGYYPWYLEADEAQFLIHILEQSLDVLRRFEEDESLIDPPTDTSYFMRIPEKTDDGLIWRDEFKEISPPESDPVDITISGPVMEAFMKLEKAVNAVEADVFMFPGQIQESAGDRPQYAYMLLIVEPETGMVFGTELLSPFPSLEQMWGQVPEAIFNAMAKIDFYPNEIRISSPRLHLILKPVADDIGFSLSLVNHLPALEQAKDFLLDRFM